MIIAATGHRPPALGGYGPAVTIRLVRLAKSALSVWQPEEVISGMAQGWDQAVAHAAVALGIPFRAYLPGPWQPDAWPPAAQEQYRRLLAQAATVRLCTQSTRYEAGAMQVRNMHMVNDADMMLALWSGAPGGTANAIDYATRGKAVPTPVVNLWEIWMQPTPHAPAER